MTKYFEITRRDGPARVGRLMMKNTITTPHIIEAGSLSGDGQIVSMGPSIDYDSRQEMLDFISETKGKDNLIILPYGNPTRNSESVLSEIAGKIPIGIAVDPATFNHSESHGADLYVIPPRGRFASNPRNFVGSVVKIKEGIPSDVALYAPAVATPENLAILIYAGVDLVDDTLAKISGFRDLYLTNEGGVHLSELSEEFPCVCEVCNSRRPEEVMKLSKKERSFLISHHNELKLTEELKRVRWQIMNGSMREYVEKQCRSSPFLTASLRLLDDESEFLENRTPVARSKVLYANTMESLDRVEIKRFAYRVRDRYSPPSKKKILLLLPCSARKPYSTSPSHYRFIQALDGYRADLHEVIITSPLGVVPRELEIVYPAAHYDIPVTGYWDLKEKAWVSGCLEDYLRNNRYEVIIAHLDGAYREICEDVACRLNLSIEYTSTDGVLGRESLNNLRSKVMEYAEGNRPEWGARDDIMKAIADYQFGSGAGDLLITDEVKIRGKFPRFQAHTDGEILATLIPSYGLLALGIKGGERLMGMNVYQVNIDDFMPKGSILAPGVTRADSQIRVGDDVMVVGEKAFGVGRAKMNGWEMVESTRGLAVDMRQIIPL